MAANAPVWFAGLQQGGCVMLWTLGSFGLCFFASFHFLKTAISSSDAFLMIFTVLQMTWCMFICYCSLPMIFHKTGLASQQFGQGENVIQSWSFSSKYNHGLQDWPLSRCLFMYILVLSILVWKLHLTKDFYRQQAQIHWHGQALSSLIFKDV